MSFREKEGRSGSKRRKGFQSNNIHAMKILTICMPDDLISGINRLVERKEFANFSEAVRFILKTYLNTCGVI